MPNADESVGARDAAAETRCGDQLLKGVPIARAGVVLGVFQRVDTGARGRVRLREKARSNKQTLILRVSLPTDRNPREGSAVRIQTLDSTFFYRPNQPESSGERGRSRDAVTNSHGESKPAALVEGP